MNIEQLCLSGKKTTGTMVYLDEEQMGAMKDEAKRIGVPLSRLLRALVVDYLSKRKK